MATQAALWGQTLISYWRMYISSSALMDGYGQWIFAVFDSGQGSGHKSHSVQRHSQCWWKNRKDGDKKYSWTQSVMQMICWIASLVNQRHWILNEMRVVMANLGLILQCRAVCLAHSSSSYIFAFELYCMQTSSLNINLFYEVHSSIQKLRHAII